MTEYCPCLGSIEQVQQQFWFHSLLKLGFHVVWMVSRSGRRGGVWGAHGFQSALPGIVGAIYIQYPYCIYLSRIYTPGFLISLTFVLVVLKSSLQISSFSISESRQEQAESMRSGASSYMRWGLAVMSKSGRQLWGSIWLYKRHSLVEIVLSSHGIPAQPEHYLCTWAL